MQKTTLLCLLLLAGAARAQSPGPTGGGGYSPPPAACVSPAQQVRIDSMLAANVRDLRRRGLLPAASQRTQAVPLSWPLRQATGGTYSAIYGISNFVDHNPAYPNQVLDWNCSNRTYDTSAGYNHQGMDIFLWPFSFNMMAANQAEIVAAAPGVIIGKYDGNYDMNCAMSQLADWNAVYVQHSDGTVAWYGHMKKFTQTSKAVGASVATGEFLGNVGSSGSSTGPHLHFELHSPQGAILDPYQGTCSATASSWITQKPYYEPTINTLMTHSAAPVFSTCPQPDVINARSNFQPGALVYYAAYYHDQQAGQSTTYTIYRPDNSVFYSWTGTASAGYNASYWYWSYYLPANAPTGTWRFTAAYQGSVSTQTFTVGTVTATAAQAATTFRLYPNPAHGRVTAELPAAPGAGSEAVIRTQLGQVVSRQPLATRQVELPLPASPGLYFVTLPTPDGPATQKLVVE